ncbi:MAG: hypothetical protein JST43_14510 [Bacteroidetes bacterium]|nr:hypothetical protein [Bacteroidota bacterium]MBS1541277.1 hypothetical protein [Bacteroidota bacterium]
MKTKIIIIALAAITLLSFTLASAHKTENKQSAKVESTSNGFTLQDTNQF